MLKSTSKIQYLTYNIYYTMVEVVTAALEDQLIDPLSFRLTKTASYITKRRSCTFHPQGSNIYHPTTGTKLIKIL